MMRFQSRCKDAALVNAAFDIRPNGDYVRRLENHPMRYWVVVGHGPVPDAFRAPETIYRQCNDALHCELYGGAAMWAEDINLTKVVHDFTPTTTDSPPCIDRWLEGRDNLWGGVVDVRDDESTTVDNLTIAPPGGDEIVFSRKAEESKTFCAPMDTATQREYFEVTSGYLAVIGDINSQYISVGNVACGKWFWQLHDFGRRDKQLVLWNELVDDNEEYTNPYSGSVEDLLALDLPGWPWEFRVLPNLRKKRAEALPVAEAFLRSADVEPLMKTALTDFLTADPDGMWWKRDELPDGFLEAGRLSLAKSYVVCDANSFFTKLKFGGSFGWDRGFVDGFSKTNALTWAVPGGCAYGPDGERYLMYGWKQFKLHNCTKKIVAVRLVVVW